MCFLNPGFWKFIIMFRLLSGNEMIHVTEYLEQLKLIYSGATFFIFNLKIFFSIMETHVSL